MGTRGACGWRKGGIDKVSYNHFDSYPEGLGEDVVEFIKNHKGTDGYKLQCEVFDKIVLVGEQTVPTKEQIEECKGYLDLGVSGQSDQDWYCLLHEAQGDLGAYTDEGLKYMTDSSGFLTDSLFCEWAYIINLDTNRLGVYKGFNNDRNAKGRYAALGEYKAGTDIYYGVALIVEIPLDVVANFPKESFSAIVYQEIRLMKVAAGELLSDEKKKEYIYDGGVRCPYCQSDDITSMGPIHLDDGGAWQQIQCNSCNKRWTDIYSLSAIEEED